MLPLLCLALIAGLFPRAARADQSWLVVSDIHLNPFDKSSVPSSYGSDSNWALWQATLREMKRADPNPPLVIVSGDFLAHHFGALVGANGGADVTGAAERTMARIARSLGQTFPRAQFLIVLGNNDDPCGDYRTAPGSRYLAAVARTWAPLIDRNGAAPRFVRSFSNAGYYTAKLPVRGLQAVALDDIYWSAIYQPCGRVSGDPGQGELAWLDRTFASTPEGYRDVVVAHIPPGIDSSSTLLAERFAVIPFLSAADEGALLADLRSESARVAFAIVGHTHRGDFRVAGGVPVLIAPSVSPVYDNDPAFLRLRVTPDGTLRDYTLYSYDPNRAAWSAEFDFDSAYGVDTFDVASLEQAHARIGSDPATRRRWAAALVAGSPHQEVDASDWRAVWCAQVLTGRGYSACARLRRRLLILPIAATLLLIIVAASIALIVSRLTGWRRR
jgi:hypothetical protein